MQRPGIAVWTGIVIPIFFLVIDPIVFRSRGASIGPAYLGEFAVGAYFCVAASTIGLSIWLIRKRHPSFFCGILLGGTTFAGLLGIALAPISIAGLLMVIGIFGLTPFLTALTFQNCAKDARQRAGKSFKPFAALVGFLLIVVPPFFVQHSVNQVIDKSVQSLLTGPNDSVESSVQKLKRLGPLFDPDKLVSAFDQTRSPDARIRITQAYRKLTHRNIADRRQILFD